MIMTQFMFPSGEKVDKMETSQKELEQVVEYDFRVLADLVVTTSNDLAKYAQAMTDNDTILSLTQAQVAIVAREVNFLYSMYKAYGLM